jgi:hypothetical protein
MGGLTQNDAPPARSPPSPLSVPPPSSVLFPLSSLFFLFREVLKIQFLTEGNQENKEDGRENNLFRAFLIKPWPLEV